MTSKIKRKTLNQNGVQIVKIGGPPSFLDFYYRMMEIGWPYFVAIVTAAFFLTNLVFGVIYASIGGINNAQPNSIIDGFYFSVETLATVGYGNMAPISPLAHFVATFEILLGLFFTATVTGLIFARFARPRSSIIFSKNAVVDIYDGKRALVTRLTSTRMHPIADMKAQMSWIQRQKMHDGREFAKVTQLPLVRTSFPRMDLSWTLVHIIDEESEFAKALAGDREYRVSASVGGHDTLLGNQTHGTQGYSADDIFLNHKFVDMISFSNQIRSIDISKLSELEPYESAV